MASDPQTDLPPAWVSDKFDLDALFTGAGPVGDGSDWACPALFESEKEQAEFLAWYRAERQKALA